MAKTQILEYTIYLRDAAKVAAYQAQLAAGTGPGHLLALPTGGFGVYRAPTGAAIEFGTAAGGASDLPLVQVGSPVPAGGAGYITSGWFTGATGFPRNVATFTHDGGWWFIGTDTKFYWSGKFALAASTSVDDTGPDTGPGIPFSQRYWIHGFELPWSGDMGGIPGAVPGSGAPILDRYCRAASRTGDGIGARFILGNTASQTDAFYSDWINPNRPTLAALWERFYIRPLRYGSATVALWQIQDNHFAGFELSLTSSGQFALFRIPFRNDPITPGDLVATFGAAPLQAWTRVDVTTDFGEMDIQVRINGALLAEGHVQPQVLTEPRYWDKSYLGCARSEVDEVDLEVDFDDWIGGAVPTDPAEYQRGSHVIRVTPDAFGPAHNAAAWAGVHGLRTLQGGALMVGVPGYTGLSSVTPSAVLEVSLPLATRATHPQSQGIVAWAVLWYGNKASSGGLDGSLGYQVGEGSPVTTPLLDQGTNEDFSTMAGQPADHGLLPAGASLRLRHVRSTDAVATYVYGLSALLELTGVFGPEDAPAPGPASYRPPVPVHQSAWPWSPWAQDVLPFGPVIVVGGTYVGTGAPRDLLLPLPPAWLLIRPVPPNHRVTRWMPSQLAAYNQSSTAVQFATGLAAVDTDDAFVPPSASADQHFQVRVRLRGTQTGADANESGVTYQYVALLDPAGRFSRAFSTAARPVGTTAIPGVPRTWPLDDPSFTPEVGLLINEFGLGIDPPYYVWKTPGHADAAANDMVASGTLPEALTFGTGAITIGAGLCPDSHMQLAALFLRRQDGNATPQPVVFAGSYVGDGSTTRTITFGTAGRRPLYAQVGTVSGTSAQYQRDPSHTGTNSQGVLAAGISFPTTAIVGGGLDSFLVGALLNVNGTTYGYWGLYGSVAAGNNGWSTNGEFAIPSDSAKPPGWVEPEVIEPPDPGGGGGPTDPGGYPMDPGAPGSDIFAECVEASTRIVNLALQEIGITKQITSLGATDDDPPVWIDTSQEAYAARMIYRTIVDTVLRDDDWAFTREYATLTATAGSVAVPVNPDWTYTYTLPIDCLRVKRICVPDTQRRYSTEPVPWDRRSSSLGYVDVLLTNEPGGGLLPEPAVGAPRTVTIEYAKRISCPARVSDAQFRECLVFRLAAGLAKALARDSADADRCLRNYTLVRPRALVNQANDQEPQRPSRGLPDWTTGR